MKMRWGWIPIILILSACCTACGGTDAQPFSESSLDVEQSSSSMTEETSAASGASSGPKEEVIKSLLYSRYIGDGLRIVPIPDIQNASEINAAWIDDNTLLFGAYNEPQQSAPELFGNKEAIQQFEKEDLNSGRLSFYRSDLATGSFTKVFDYPLDGRLPFLYLTVLDNGGFAFKTNRELVVVSGADYTVSKKIAIPPDVGIANMELSPDGRSVAVVENQSGLLTVRSMEDQTELYSLPLHQGIRYSAPQWSSDDKRLFMYTYGYEFADSALIINLADETAQTYGLDGPSSKAFWHENAGQIQQYFVAEGQNDVAVGITKCDLKTGAQRTKAYALEMGLSPLSISDNGYLIGEIYNNEFYTVLIDTNKDRAFFTERTQQGGGILPFIWSKSGTHALGFYTAVTDDQDNPSRWTVVVYDVERLLKYHAEDIAYTETMATNQLIPYTAPVPSSFVPEKYRELVALLSHPAGALRNRGVAQRDLVELGLDEDSAKEIVESGFSADVINRVFQELGIDQTVSE